MSLRPQRGEILYSWVARIAGFYSIFPEELFPEEDPTHCVDAFIQGSFSGILERLAVRTGVPTDALAKRTLAHANKAWPSDWCSGSCDGILRFRISATPLLQVCPQCLADDVRNQMPFQFIRLRWQCPAVTICNVHSVPLQQSCPACNRACWPVCERISLGRLRFVCRECGSPREKSSWATSEPSEDAIRLLIRFERQLVRALANYAVEWCWIGHSTPQEFLRLVGDLLWALTRHSYHSKPIYALQSRAFPLPHRVLPEIVDYHWRFASPAVRRCLLASALGVFGGSRVRSILQGHRIDRLRWHELLCHLSGKDIEQLERRSWHWPPAAHNVLHRAAQLPRGKALRRKFDPPFYQSRNMWTSLARILLN